MNALRRIHIECCGSAKMSFASHKARIGVSMLAAWLAKVNQRGGSVQKQTVDLILGGSQPSQVAFCKAYCREQRSEMELLDGAIWCASICVLIEHKGGCVVRRLAEIVLPKN